MLRSLVGSEMCIRDRMYIESYGCQMNFSDSEIVASIICKENYSTTKDISEADLVFVNTCSIRDKAEQTVRKRLQVYNSIKKSVNPNVNNFRDFPKYLNKLKKDKPVAMFCTGGIRCEKTSIYLKKKGFKNIYQLNGGILNYLK